MQENLSCRNYQTEMLIPRRLYFMRICQCCKSYSFFGTSYTYIPKKVTTIFARNYGTAAVISYNLKGIAPPVPPVQCWIDKNLMSGCEPPTLKRVGGGRVGKMDQ